ncbi:hypothetical protein [Streptomyces antibioticus]|uniref:hypothetical protein n=1 Tax=Streptomyces antibioticus TaxID=1890 RepID=UPI0022571BF7|nr:hypothetical protein [Streptomyces antibioticus]MCX4739040.1 hypothetical protein [Streptomyces antibioticus]
MAARHLEADGALAVPRSRFGADGGLSAPRSHLDTDGGLPAPPPHLDTGAVPAVTTPPPTAPEVSP